MFVLFLTFRGKTAIGNVPNLPSTNLTNNTAHVNRCLVSVHSSLHETWISCWASQYYHWTPQALKVFMNPQVLPLHQSVSRSERWRRPKKTSGHSWPMLRPTSEVEATSPRTASPARPAAAQGQAAAATLCQAAAATLLGWRPTWCWVCHPQRSKILVSASQHVFCFPPLFWEALKQHCMPCMCCIHTWLLQDVKCLNCCLCKDVIVGEDVGPDRVAQYCSQTNLKSIATAASSLEAEMFYQSMIDSSFVSYFRITHSQTPPHILYHLPSDC